MEKLSTDAPVRLWEIFEQICQIPRPSKKEHRILGYLVNFAQSNNLDYKQDQVGNIVIKKNATPGNENMKTVVLQSHVDMVGEKEKTKVHNFDEDPIKTRIKQG